LRTRVNQLGLNFFGEELFDVYEIGSDQNTGLIKGEAILSQVQYYSRQIHPLIYRPYYKGNFKLNRSDTYTTGIPPSKAIRLTQTTVPAFGSDHSPKVAALEYNLVHYFNSDYADLRCQAAVAYQQTGRISDSGNQLLTKTFPSILPGEYPLELQYFLPGKSIPNSSVALSIKNPF
jgi:hypothetical protein